MTKQEYRIAICHILSDLLKEPQDIVGGVKQQDIDFLHGAFQAIQCRIEQKNYQMWPLLSEDINKLKQAFNQSFVYPIEKRILPVESIYRQWTLDSTFDVPFAREKGYLMSDFAMHMQALYGQYQLSIPDEYSSMPDHLCLELEFYAFLLEHESKERQNVFVNEHLNWVNELCQDAVERNISRFYLQVIRVIAGFLEHEINSAKRQSH